MAEKVIVGDRIEVDREATNAIDTEGAINTDTGFKFDDTQVVGEQQAAIEPTQDELTLDDMTGTGNTAPAAETNIDLLVDSTGATADDTVADCSTAVTGVDGSGSNAASKADVDTRLGVINANFKELVDQVITQKALNTVLINDAKTFATQLNKVLADIAAIVTALETHGLIATPA